MSRRRPPIPRLPRSRLAVAMAAAAGILLFAPCPAAASWERAHSDGANTGFADVATAPAGRYSVSIPGLGSFAPGAGPVIAPDGTVYIGSEQGKLFAFHADGRPAWSRELPRGQAIAASPAIGADGSIYVVGVSRVRDHRVDPPVIRYHSTLHRFLPGGGWVWQAPFPERYATFDAFRGSGTTTAAPNIWRSQGVEAVMVPVVNGTPGGYDLRLVAFATSGAVLAETRVTHVQYEITSESDEEALLCLIPPITVGCVVVALVELALGPFGRTIYPSFSVTVGDTPSEDDVHRLRPYRVPLPGVAVIDGTPWVVVSDVVNDVVGYTFTPGDGFIERFRSRDPELTVSSPPTITRDGHSVFARAGESGGAVVFGGPNAEAAPGFPMGYVYAAPTRLGDGRIVVVEAGGGIAELRGYVQAQRIELPGASIASAAASRNHVFVSTASALYTFDARTLQEVSRIDWVGGGLWPPAIGPQGHVYAMASNILFVFPPPAPCRRCSVEPPTGGGVVQ